MHYIKYVPLALFSLFVSKGLIVGFNWTDAPVCAVLGVIAAYYEYKAQDKKLKELIHVIEVQKEEIQKARKDIDDVKTHIASIKMATGFRSVNKIG